MIYATIDNLSLIVSASDNISEMAQFAYSAQKDINSFDAFIQMSPKKLILDNRFDDFVYPPYIIDFSNEKNLLAFVQKFNVKILSKVGVVEKQVAMLAASRKTLGPSKRKTIGEITGLDKEDKWKDPELEEEAEAKKKKLVDRAKEKGMDDGSFSSDGLEKGKINLNKISIEIGEDGKPKIINAQAERINATYDQHVDMINEAERQVKMFGQIRKKNFFFFASGMMEVPNGKNGMVFFFVKKLRYIDDNDKAIICEDEEICDLLPEGLINFAPGIYEWPGIFETNAHNQLKDKGFILDFTIVEAFGQQNTTKGRPLNSKIGSLFYRFDVKTDLVDLDTKLDLVDRTYMDGAAGYGEAYNLAWFAYENRNLALAFKERLSRKGIVTNDVYAVNAAGKRLIEEGANVKKLGKDKNQLDIGPRPWNNRALELDKMSKKARKKNLEEYSGKEFIVCGTGANENDVTNEIQVYIAPIEYFIIHKELYPSSLNIESLLPDYVKEISPGLYSIKNIDYATAMFDLCNKLGMKESIELQMHVNSL